MLGWLTLIIAGLAGLFFLFQKHEAVVGLASTELIAAVVLLVLFAVYFSAVRGREAGEHSAGRKSVIAISIALILALVTTLWWFAPDKIKALITPPTAEDRALDGVRGVNNSVSVLLRRSADNTFVAQGQINGIATKFLVDTGATAVMLKHSDAEKAGVDVKALAFSTPVQTANGTVYAAPARLRSIQIGALRRDDVEALVAMPGSLNENLLGMSFLRRLSSYDLKGEFLTLRD